jgi:hypothetical protein
VHHRVVKAQVNHAFLFQEKNQVFVDIVNVVSSKTTLQNNQKNPILDERENTNELCLSHIKTIKL